MKTWWIAPAWAGAVVMFAACAEPRDDVALVARVGDSELTVDEVVDLLVDEERLSANVGVIQTLAEYWIDYTLLAEAAAEDTTFSNLDLELLVQQQLWQTMVAQLRDSVIQFDTFITEDELEALYAAEDPDVQLRARHIMLTYPFEATQAQRDSVRSVLEELRQRIVDGTSFESIAGQYSQDPGTARSGGDLGYFSRGDMVVPFEEATLALEPGEMSGVVETPMGLHLIRLEERRTRAIEDVALEFRRRVQGQRVQAAESTFIAGIEARVDPQLRDGAVGVAREIARNPGTRLSRRAARRRLVEWKGGALSVGDFQSVMWIEPSGLRDQLIAEPDERLETFLKDLARRDLLVEEARSAGLQPTRAHVDSLVTDAEDQLRAAARMLGLLDLDQAPGEARELAIARAVGDALTRNLSGATRFVPLGLISFQLRDRASFGLYGVGMGQAIIRIAQIRSARSPSLLENAFDSLNAAPDTVGP